MFERDQVRSTAGLRIRRHPSRLACAARDPTASAVPNADGRDGRPHSGGGECGGEDARDGALEIGDMTDATIPPEFAHELYIDGTNLREALADCSPERSLEVGCGYGRLTPWIAARADEHVAIDPDRALLSAARREYPGVRFARARAEALPFRDGAFDLAVTWGVLNHVPSASIREATDEIDRVVAADGTLVISEATAGTPDPRWEYRQVAEWRDLFAGRELRWRTATERDEEPFRDPDREHVVMKFR
ncbi:class I SAM-dependent methyltransferase [Natrinema sp. 74]|uniref:class I SAM-dependent methyltransferase n=1 Tax=Natrinema sp. 74 TaxID=3384159 RepID=UPI0038D3C2CB